MYMIYCNMIYAIDAYTYRLYMIGINMFECCLGACGRVRQKDVLVQKSSLTALIRRRFVVSEPTAPSVFHKHRFNQRHWWRILDHVRLPGRWCVWRSPTWHSAGVLSIAQLPASSWERAAQVMENGWTMDEQWHEMIRTELKTKRTKNKLTF